jgi:ketosteroid isomerase-like protein
MSTRDNVELVQRMYAEFGQGNIPAVLDAVSEDVEWFIPGPVGLIPFVGRRTGREQVGEFFATLAATETAVEFEPREFIAEGDQVVVLGHQRWTVKATGITYEDDWAHVLTVRDGKVVRFREYHDTYAEAVAHELALPGERAAHGAGKGGA